MEFTLGQVAEILQGKVEGDENQKVSRLDKIQEGKAGGISFLANEKYTPFIYETAATAVIVSNTFVPTKPLKTNLIRVEDAYTGFTMLLEAYAMMMKSSVVGIEEPSYMDSSSQMGEHAYRGAFSYIGKNCKIGTSVKLYSHVHIGDRVQIGDNTIIHTGAKICADTIIGNNCEIHPGAVIGSDGFGFAPQQDGTYKAIPQIGNVILEDNVSVGANSTIDCATMGSTLIKKGAKIDNMVQIAHNVIIGENTVIASQTGISGSTEIGKNCVIAGKAGIVGHIKIADNTTIGANTGVSKSIPTPGTTLFGYIGFDMKNFLKSYSLFKKLGSIEDRIRELEKKQ
ncbi:UDP-3-O-(3-hydroxymyristoyl)glucosamine N-acyltransferase [Algoriphagus aquimarinus]|uniref:UDP-3-O-acylglucosamine N-acyltransferase n=1 Tax=Algoriphagus aquimarinus TaxID=237018 RepID=A0A1I1BR59_9BACT|nr:UDP-3-O-(3-hydroxymyristoyl)glucosamine N-acyltransferase [Algoriphagus aquimarinus]SFB52781.1 UDP-3-O-[3-hydroxymyristoyl] glucosamine N-acyltransferase [Algoriphagus aquimarinus]|tara:strand:- start:19544 stop:20566 length:1023 start_codon:yes stop_codon:yes gene_type:complete